MGRQSAILDANFGKLTSFRGGKLLISECGNICYQKIQSGIENFNFGRHDSKVKPPDILEVEAIALLQENCRRPINT